MKLNPETQKEWSMYFECDMVVTEKDIGEVLSRINQKN